jgi:hypothetical protein
MIYSQVFLYRSAAADKPLMSGVTGILTGSPDFDRGVIRQLIYFKPNQFILIGFFYALNSRMIYSQVFLYRSAAADKPLISGVTGIPTGNPDFDRGVIRQLIYLI